MTTRHPNSPPMRPVRSSPRPANSGPVPPQSVRRPAPPYQRAADGRSKLWRNLALGAGGIVLLLAVAIVTLSLAFPGDLVRDRIVAEVKSRTGRDLTINGPVTFSSVPAATVFLNDVSLSGPPGSNTALASIKTLEVSVDMLPLLWREVAVGSIVLKDAVIDLAVDRDGRRNWNFERREAAVSPPVRLAQATANDAGPPRVIAQHRLPDISLRDVRIDNGMLRYTDARTGILREASQIEAQFAVKSLQHPADANGSLVYRGEHVNFALEIGAVEPIFQNMPARVALKLSSPMLTAAYEGTILFGGNEADGALTANAPSTARAASWLGATLPAEVRTGPLDLSGQLRLSGRVYTVSNASLTFNGAHATGQVALDTAPARPVLRGSLESAEIDLNAMLQPPPEEPATPSANQPRNLAPIRTEEPPFDETPRPDGADAAIRAAPEPRASATRVNGYTARGGWSEEPIRLAALSALDADLKIGVGGLLYKSIKVGRSRLALSLRDKVLTTKFDELNLYGGHGIGSITVSAHETGADPSQHAVVTVDMTFDDVAVRPLLQDAAQLNWIEGKGRVSVAVSGAGQSQRGLIESLQGKATLDVAQGAIVGVDVERMADALGKGDFKSLKTEPGDKTNFSGLAATWAIKDGIATNTDLRVSNDLVHVTGTGTVALPDRTIDYTIKPKIAGKAGENGKGVSGIEVPVRVSGSWEKPVYKADVGSTIDEVGRRLKGKNRDEIVDELVGKDSETGKKAKKLLDKLFR